METVNLPPSQPAKPVWGSTDQHFWLHLWRALFDTVGTFLLRYGRYRGNKIAYLRHLGVRIGQNCTLVNSIQDYGSEPWLIELGNHVQIAHGVVFITHDGASRLFRHRVPGASLLWGNRFGTVRVLDNSFIGVNALVLPGVQIGPNSIVGAGSVVSKDVPPDSVVAGVPARLICSLEEYVQRYEQKMIPIEALDRQALRRELTQKLWGEPR